jgi:uncharacterized protein DUF6893
MTLAVLAGVALIVLIWREIPAMKRYIKIEKM